MTATTILCFGDSNTWGFIPGSDCERYAPDVRWPGVMAADLGPGYRVVEEAQNGRMTAWEDPAEPFVSKCGLTFLPVVLESQKPIDLVIIMLGTNDLKLHMNHTARAQHQGRTALEISGLSERIDQAGRVGVLRLDAAVREGQGVGGPDCRCRVAGIVRERQSGLLVGNGHVDTGKPFSGQGVHQ